MKKEDIKVELLEASADGDSIRVHVEMPVPPVVAADMIARGDAVLSEDGTRLLVGEEKRLEEMRVAAQHVKSTERYIGSVPGIDVFRVGRDEDTSSVEVLATISKTFLTPKESAELRRLLALAEHWAG